MLQAPYNDEDDKVYEVVEGVDILYEVHDVSPALQGDDEEDRHPGEADVVKTDRAVEGIGGASRTVGVELGLNYSGPSSHHLAVYYPMLNRAIPCSS